MTLAKFFLRYTVIPFAAIVLVAAYPSFTPTLKHEVADALRGGRLAKADYGAIMRDALDAGFVVDWPAPTDDVGGERGRLLGLVNGDLPASR